MQETVTVLGLHSQPEVEKEFVELDREYEVLWAREAAGGWAVGLEKVSPKAPEGTAPYRARAMNHNVRTGYHNPIRGLNYYRNRNVTLEEAKRSAATLYESLSRK